MPIRTHDAVLTRARHRHTLDTVFLKIFAQLDHLRALVTENQHFRQLSVSVWERRQRLLTRSDGFDGGCRQICYLLTKRRIRYREVLGRW
jgi:hypothetical protein